MTEHDRIYQKLYAVETFIRDKGYMPIYTCLHGSQNYGLDLHTDEYQSDYDFKCVVLPDLCSLVKDGKPVSVVYDFEGGHVDVKDIRVFFDTVFKMNPAYLECLKTMYYIGNEPFGEPLIAARDSADYLLMERGWLFTRSVCGMFKEKEKALCHPYPTLVHKIEQYGYDGKQAHHMYRLLLLLKAFEQTGELNLTPPPSEIAFLQDLKLNRYSLNKVLLLIEDWKKELAEVRARLEVKYPTVHPDTARTLKTISQQAVYHYCLTPRGTKRQIEWEEEIE